MGRDLFLLINNLLINILYIGIIVIEIRVMKRWKIQLKAKRTSAQLLGDKELMVLKILLIATVISSIMFSVLYSSAADSLWAAVKYSVIFLAMPPYCIFLTLAVIMLIKCQPYEIESDSK